MRLRGDVETELLRLPIDRRRFLRRECPCCHRQFKSRWSVRDASRLQVELGSCVLHVNAEEVTRADAGLRCPYCGEAPAGDPFWTHEQRAFLGRRAKELGATIRYEQLRFIERTLGQNPNLGFLPVAPVRAKEPRRIKRLDLKRLPLACCSEELELQASWNAEFFCPYCGCTHELPRG